MTFEVIYGSAGSDDFTHVSGNKVYLGGEGNDSFKMASNSTGQAIFVGGPGDDHYTIHPSGLQYIRDGGGGIDVITISDGAFYRPGQNFVVDNRLSLSFYPATSPSYSERFAGIESSPEAAVVFGYLNTELDYIEQVSLPSLVSPLTQDEALSFYRSAPSWGGAFTREDSLSYGVPESIVSTAFLNMNSVTDLTQSTDSALDPAGPQHKLTVIADVLGSVMLLENLNEVITETSHTIEYNGTTFDYAEVDGIITTVVRDGEFTDEFAVEIAESYPESAGISYSNALALIGQANIESTLMMVAGADGNYVG